MATHLLHRYSWIFFAVMMLASIGSPQALAQSCPTGSDIGFTNVTCPGANDGTATVEVFGGVPNYVFVLQKRVGIASYTTSQVSPEVSETKYTFTGIAPGNYRFEIYDSQVETCIPIYSEGFIIGTTGTTPADVTISGSTEVCEGQVGVTYSVPLTSGSSYSWSVPGDASIVTGATGPENNVILVNFGATSGQIKVTETNSGGCSGNEASLNVTVVPAPTQYILSTTDATTFCEGSAGASLNLSDSDLGITYVLLRNGVEINTVAGSGSALTFGTYNLSGTYTATAYVTSSSSCTAAMEGSVTLNATSPATLSASVTNVSCAGGSDGAIDLTISNGTAPFDILWSTGATTEDLSGLVAGIYTVKVTDASECLVELSVEVGSPDPLSISEVITHVSCFDAANGSIDITVTGGTAPYTYEWSNGATTEDISGLDVGSYTIIIRDANNCEATQSFVITEPALLTASAAVLQEVSCFGGNEGAIDLAVEGGTAPYTYAWSNNATTEDLTGLVAGTYVVTVTDANGCKANAEATISQPAALAAVITVSDATTCGGNEGSIDLEVSGGIAPYRYLWSTGATTQDIFELTAGTYTVVVTDTNDCTLEASATVGQPAGISSLSGSITNVSCQGAANGAIDLTVNGGTAPYSYEWSTGATTEDISALAPGRYSVTVTDATNCQSSQSFDISEPAALELSAALTHLTCAGANTGAIDLTVNGGTAPYTYEWSNGATTEDISTLAAGDYTIIIRDANGCRESATYTINDGAILELSAILSQLVCNGSSTGAIDLTVNGGTAPYTYEWSNGATTEDITGLTAGTYEVTVTDATTCSATASFEITQPVAVSLSTTLTHVTTCGSSTGAIDLTVTGGTAPYTYLWSNGSRQEDLRGLSAGEYSVTVTDANECQAETSVFINEPTGITAVDGALTHVSCFGTSTGAIDITVSGGTAPYTYEWSNGAATEDISGLTAGTYEVTVTDGNNCSFTNSFIITEPAVLNLIANVTDISCKGEDTGAIDLSVEGGTAVYSYSWSNGATTQDLSNVGAGVYSVEVTDANGCRQTAEYTISEPTSGLLASATATDVTCAGGLNGGVDVTVSGGTAPYTYAWSNGATTEDLTAVAAGNYSVVITDAAGCTASASAVVEEPAALTASISGSTSLCPGSTSGSLTAAAQGGTADYTYLWNTGATTATIENLAAGTYTVEITDANACMASATHTISQPVAIELTTAVTNTSSCTGNDGSIDLTITAGEGPFTYLWSNGATTEDISNLAAGEYTVTVTDAIGCSATTSATVLQPDLLNLTAVATDATSCGGNQGSIDLTITGGTAPYSYSWSNGATTEDITALTAGLYTVTATDANGCFASLQVSVGEPAGISSLTAVTTDATCGGAATGAIDLTVNGGTAPYTYLWSNGATTEDISGLAVGEYTITVTDANSCKSGASFLIAEPAALELTAQTVNTSSCGASDGAIDLTVAGGVAPYSYSWSNGATTEDVDGLVAGTYTVTITDAAGCTATATYAISDGSGPSLTASIKEVSCAGAADGAIDLSVSGGKAPYTYTWSTGASSEDLFDLAAGEYAVTVTDATGCIASAAYSISQPAAIELATVVTSLTSCSGNDGAIDLSITAGGVAPFTYLWNTGATTEDLIGLAAGTYTVTITDAAGCTASTSATVSQPAVLALSASATDATSCGGNQGSIDVTVSGGAAPYTYSWNTGATTEDISSLTAGEYTITVTDANGCTAILSATVAEPGSISSLTASTTEVVCNGAATGAIDLTVNGGEAPFTFLWNTGATTEDLSGLIAGEYTVTVSDVNGCQANGSFTISQPAALELTAQTQNTSACQAADGAIDLSVNGGAAPFTYQWSNGATTEDINGLIAGTYTVVVTDANACTQTAAYAVNDANGPTLEANVQHVSCFGATSGAIDISISGGTAPYTYSWNTGATTEDLTGLAAGTYSVIVTDALGCSAAISAEVNEPLEFTASAQATAVSCQGTSDGTIDLSVSGGVGPYTYLWSNAATTEDLSNLAAGKYDVTITDGNGCSIQASATVTEPAALSAIIEGTSSVCAGSTDGSLTVTAAGGTEPYMYVWNTGATTATLENLAAGTYTVTVTDGNTCTTTASFTIEEEQLEVTLGEDIALCAPASVELNAGYSIDTHTILWSTGETTTAITVSATGTYSVTVTDRATGCSDFDEILVEIEDEFVPTVTISPVTPISCNSEEVHLQAEVTYGGASPVFTWMKNGEVIAGETSNELKISSFQNGDNIEVIVVSSLSCANPTSAMDDFIIELPVLTAPVLSSTEDRVCLGSTIPTITAEGELIYWYRDRVDPANRIFTGNSFTPSDNAVGTYVYYATQGGLLCAESPATRYTLELYEGDCEPVVCDVNPAVAIRVIPDETICSDIKTVQLEADLTQVGENPQYAWFFNGASTPFSTEASPSFTKAEGFVTGDVFKVEITITDEAFICNGNTVVSDVESITVMAEVQATASILPIDAVCADSSTPVTLTAEGDYIDWRFAGLATRYEWFIGTDRVKDALLDSETSTANQLEIVPNQLPADAQVRLVVTLPEGVSCVLPPAEATYTIPFAEPVAPSVSLSSSAPNGACPGTSITFTASATNAGINPTFVFLVDDAEVQRGISSTFVLSAPEHGQRVLAKVLVTDATGLCLSTTEASSTEQTVQILTTEECVGGSFNCGVFGAKLTSFTRPSCGERNGALYYEISGGSPSYFIRYSFAGEQVEQVVNETSFILAIERIPAGEVKIYMRDSKGNECSLTTILEAEPQLTITFEKSTNGDVLCYGEATGKARLTVEGGNAPYQYLLDGASEWQTLNGNTIEFTTLPAGIVNIMVRDDESDTCPAVASLEILNVNEAIEITYTVTQQANCNDNIGAFSLDAITGGASANGYKVKLITDDNWREFTPGMLFTGLARGRHTLMINDGVCQVSKQVVVPSPGLIALTEDSGPIEFTCENPELRNGLYLKVDASITEVAGPYMADIYLMNSTGTYDLLSRDELFNGSGELYRFYLERGRYQVEVRSQNREGCPEVREFVIEGSEIPEPITFVAEPLNIYCADAVGGIRIRELKGAAGLPYQVEVYKGTELITSRTITPFEHATQQSWDITGLNQELYKVIIKQDQGLCTTIEQSKPAEVIIIEIQSKLAVTLTGTTVSFPEHATGTLSFRITNGSGTAPYEASLVWKTRLETQEDWAFESYGDPVPMNGTTGKYDYTYNNLPPGVYELTVTDSKGCSVVLTDTVDFDTNIFVPNYISPNGDGKNEVFHIRNKAARTHLIVTNRWGKVVYENKDYQNDWDGGSLPEGVYYYSIIMPLSEKSELKGWLQIKRGAKPF